VLGLGGTTERGRCAALEGSLMTRRPLPVSRPVKQVGAGVLLAASGSCLAIATRTVGLWWPILWCLIGAGVGMAGLLVVNDLIADLLGEDPAPGAQWAGLGSGLVGTAIGVLATVGGMRRENTALAIAGLLIALVSVLVVLISVRSRTAARPALLFGLGVAGMVPLVVAAATSDRFDRAVGAAIGCWLVGLTLAKLGLAPWIDDAPETRRTAVTIGAGAAVVVGVGALVLGAQQGAWWLLVVAVSLVIGGLSALGISLPRWDLRRAAPWLIGAGGVAVIVGLVPMAVVLRAVGPVVVGGGAVAAIGAWYVFRGEGLLAVTLIGARGRRRGAQRHRQPRARAAAPDADQPAGAGPEPGGQGRAHRPRMGQPRAPSHGLPAAAPRHHPARGWPGARPRAQRHRLAHRRGTAAPDGRPNGPLTGAAGRAAFN
jgi:hypothetical protein